MDEKKPEPITNEELNQATVGRTAKGKRLLDPDVVKRMREAGLPRPEEVASNSWEQVQTVREGSHTLVAHLAACGLKPGEIAEATGLNLTTVKKYLDSEKIKFEIRHLQHKYFGADPMRRFRTMVGQATDTIEEVMNNPNAKDSVRVIAADKIMDRALGRPKQFLQVEGSLIRKIYETLDEKKKTIDVSAIPEAQTGERVVGGNVVEKVDRKENPNLQPEEQKDWSGWIDKNL